jgi:cell division protein FtsI (penicillin-binding protein 3)
MRSQALKSAALRVRILQGLLMVGFLGLAGRAGYLTIIETKGGDLGNRQGSRGLELRGPRGLILDRDHRELAISIEAPSVYVLPQKLTDRKAAISALARILDMPVPALTKRIGDRKKFVYIARWITQGQADQIQALDLPGVGLKSEPRRTYPAGPLGASVLGFVDIDGTGRRGIEQMMDAWLQDNPRRIEIKVNARGKLLVHEGIDFREMAGGDIVLTLDAALQAQAENALAQSMATSGASRGLVVVVEPKTGDVLTLAEAPAFDPNSFRKLRYHDTRSRAFTDAVEPGSTFKAFLVGAALQAGILDQQTVIDTGEGRLRLPGKVIEDKRKIGATDAAGVLRHSSNVGAALIAKELGGERYQESLERFGFGSTTKSGFPGESAGLMRNWQNWKPVDQANIAFGQGINVTAIQLAMAAAALANGGERMRPRLILAKRTPVGKWQTLPPVSAGQAISPEAAQNVMEMLETVVSASGTGRQAALADVRVAGKTGTAQLLDPNGSYSRTRHTAWFIGFAPVEDPKVAIVVGLEEPNNGGGGAVAAPLFAKVAAAQLARHGILTFPEPIAAVAIPREPMHPAPRHPIAQGLHENRRGIRPVAGLKLASAEPAPRTPAQFSAGRPAPKRPTDSRHSVLVPNFQGISLNSARSLASDEFLELRFRGPGRGQVIRQDPAPGTILGGSQRTVVVSFSTDQGEG